MALFTLSDDTSNYYTLYNSHSCNNKQKIENQSHDGRFKIYFFRKIVKSENIFFVLKFDTICPRKSCDYMIPCHDAILDFAFHYIYQSSVELP